MELNQELIAITPQVSSGNLHESMMDICGIGNRWVGTSGEEQAIEYMQSKMKFMTHELLMEEYSYPLYAPELASLIVRHPVKKSIDCVGAEYAENGSVEGRLIYVGEGSSGDFATLLKAGVEFKDVVVLARSNRPYVVCREGAKWGAVGAILISDSPFNTIRQITSQMGFEKGADLMKFGAPIPAVIVGRDSGEHLASLASAGPVEVKIMHSSSVKLKQSYNVIGYVHGRDKPQEQVIIGAHYDTQQEIEGAWDNASGCAALLEIMRVCSTTKPKRTMVFCAFGGEEIGLFGSTHFVQGREKELANIIGYINLDSTSADMCYIHELLVTKGMKDFALGVIKENTNWWINQFREYTPLDHEQDSAEFVKCGVNAIWAHEEGNPYFHTKYDTLATINPAKHALATRVALLPFFYLANVEDVSFTEAGR